MLTLFHSPHTRSSRVVWLVEELGADCEIRYVTIPRRDGSSGPDASNPHPDKKVPALMHDDVLITESIAICQYLCDLHPDAEVSRPIGHPERGPSMTWLAYYAGVAEPVLNAQFAGIGDNPIFHTTFRSRAEYDARILAALESRPYLIGDTPCAADVVFADMGINFRDLLPAGDAVDAWLGRMKARPAYERALTREEPPA